MKPLLTIIIPTYNRPESLLRTVRFLRRRSPALPLIVADGSTAQYAPRNAESAGFGDNIAYFHEPSIPDEKPWKNYCRRMRLALARNDTPYSVACADDDLLISENAVDAARFLESNTDYVGCHGHYLQFEYSGGGIKVPNVEYQGPPLDAADVPARLLQLFSHYEALFYAVFRTAAMRVLLDRYSEPEPPLWPEIYHSTGAVVAGKVHRNDKIFCLRNIGNAPHYRSDSSFLNFGQWIAADFEGFLAHYAIYRSRVLGWSAAGPDSSVLKALDIAFLTYIGSEFDLGSWIERACETVADKRERETLRLRLSGNLSHMAAGGAPASVRQAGRGLIQAMVTQSKMAARKRIGYGGVYGTLERRRWHRLELSGQSDPATIDTAGFCDIEVKKSLFDRFPSHQWHLLAGIEKPSGPQPS